MVERIERIVNGVVLNIAATRNGRYCCLPRGQTLTEYAVYFETLEEVAAYLIRHPRSSVRMDPGWDRIVDNICIDGTPREDLAP